MKILLHICCSNCALYPVTLFQSEGHALAGFWFNPNIHPVDEYNLRLVSLRKLAKEWKFDVIFREEYQPDAYFNLFDFHLNGSNSLNGLKIPAPPERCTSCYHLRLDETAREARDQGFDSFTTTLLISPYQNFNEIARTGEMLSEKYNVEFLCRDVRPYFNRSKALSKKLSLYRQKYCGCIFSKNEGPRKTSQRGRRASNEARRT